MLGFVANIKPRHEQRTFHTISAALEAQVGKIPGLLLVETGFNTSPSRRAGDFVLICDFTNPAALAGYHRHPAHFHARVIVDPLIDEHWIVDYALSTVTTTE